MGEEYVGAGQATDDSIMLRRKHGLCMPNNWGKNTHTHTHNIFFLLIALLWQQWSRERASMLYEIRNAYIACLVI